MGTRQEIRSALSYLQGSLRTRAGLNDVESLTSQQFAVLLGAGRYEIHHGASRRQVDQIGVGEEPHIGETGQLLRRYAHQVRMGVADEA